MRKLPETRQRSPSPELNLTGGFGLLHPQIPFMSALLEQYKTIKAKYPDAILLFRIGDFYETFGEDAKLASQKLGITLTQSSNDELKEMASFPFHSLDVHLRTLVQGGYRVAVCEQLEDPKTAKRIVKRGVTDSFKP